MKALVNICLLIMLILARRITHTLVKRTIESLDLKTAQKLDHAWRQEFKENSRKKSYLLGVIAALIFPATLIDLSMVTEGNQSIFILTRTLPSALILFYLALQRLFRLPDKPGYYITFVAVITAAAFRVNDTDTSNFLLLNATCFIMFAILASLKLRDTIIMSVYATIVNIIFYFWLYAETIPPNNAGLLVIIALEVIFVLVIKFRYDILKRNFLNSMLLQHQKEEIEKQRNNLLELNEEIHQQKEEILSQRDAIEQKRAELEKTLQKLAKKNANITASITYAQRIQEAMLPNLNTIQSFFPHAFVLYKPRDIVSGDFYWVKEKNGWVIFAAADCTGHGVPGAFMSITGDAILSQIVEVQGITAPAEILNQLHIRIRSGLKQKETHNRDGMDIAVCAYNFATRELCFAGAQNQLLYVQNGEMKRLRGNRQPIGGLQRETERIFTNHSIHITVPTMCYLFSDGYQDQFGGKDGRKFMNHRFRELLLANHQKPAAEQERILDETLNQWISEGNEQQIDDILVMGVLIQP